MVSATTTRSLAIAAALAMLPSVSSCTSAPSSYVCCQSLITAGLGERLFYPNSTQYEARIDSYWSVSAQLSPWCIVQPLSAQEVSTALTTLLATDGCEIAVRSGGHTTWPGANNINQGVTIDLGSMNATTYHAENSTASILPGSRWLQVYETLDAIGMTVPGGRAGTVGVAGLVIGGGNSFYSARVGLVCDNVVQYEVVLATGEIIYATNDTYPDLFRALKGGTGNFGIVTRFDLNAFEAPNLWGGTLTYNTTNADALISAMNGFADNVANDPYSSSIIFWTFQPALQQTVVAAAYENTAGITDSPSFVNYTQIPYISSTMRVTNMSDLVLELEQPTDYRDIWFTLTFKNDVRVLNKAVELHDALVEDFKTISPDGDFITQCMFQPFPTLFAQHSVEHGGNVLGIDQSLTDNSILLLATLAVKGEDQETIGRVKVSAWVEAIHDYAVSIGADTDFLYLNYADYTQKPLESYGAENVAKIRAAAAKYDPEGVFQTRIPGGFKISNVV